MVPRTIVVREGETVTLEILGVNGDVHPSTIPGIVDSFTVKHGEVTRVTFTAPKPGLYPSPVPSTRRTCRAPSWCCPSRDARELDEEGARTP
jgi:hypothetical protein